MADAVDFSAQLAQLKSEYRRSRMAEFYRTVRWARSSPASAADAQRPSVYELPLAPLNLLFYYSQPLKVCPLPQQILSRELLLKLNVRSVNELPRLERVDLAVQAKDAGGTAYVSGCD